MHLNDIDISKAHNYFEMRKDSVFDDSDEYEVQSS